MRVKKSYVIIGALLALVLVFNVPVFSNEALDPSKETTLGYRMKDRKSVV